MKRLLMIKFTLLILLVGVFSSSCEKIEEVKQYKNVLVLGNSITKHAPLPEVGWYGDWGMAASTKDKDFVHLLGERLGANKITPINISAFEVHHSEYNLNLLDIYLENSVDLIVIRIGENVNNQVDFDKSFLRLVEHIQKKSNPKVKILVGGTFWKNDQINETFKSISIKKNLVYVEMSHLDLPENKSYMGAPILVDGKVYKVEHYGVANHPGDVGMKKIADLLFEAVYNDTLYK